MSAVTLEGTVVIDRGGLGFSDIRIGETSVVEWCNDVIPFGTNAEPRTVKAILMAEDKVYLEAIGALTAAEGEEGYSSLTPGSGPSVYVWDEASFNDFTVILEDHEGRVVCLSLEAM